jgi:hypothetical protein
MSLPSIASLGSTRPRCPQPFDLTAFLQGNGLACAIGGQGAAFTASLGPDLATTFDGMPAEALDGLLADLPLPSMAPVYEGRPEAGSPTASARGRRDAFRLSFALGPGALTGVAFLLGIAMGIGKAAVYKHIPHCSPDRVGSAGGSWASSGGSAAS